MHTQNKSGMNKKLLLCLLVALSPIISFAQGALTVFSEDGDRFYLVLNGVKQNPTPQTNVRVDGLTSQFYSAKILFEDNTKPEITKSVPVTDPGTSNFAEVTYKIKRTKDGELKLRYFGATPVPPVYNPPADMYYVHFGQSAPVSGGVVSHTTTTTTTTTAAPTGASLNVNAAGVNMNVNVSDPDEGGAGLNMNINVNDGSMGATTTTSRTTTRTTTRVVSSSSSYSDGGYTTTAPPPSNNGGCMYPMSASDFAGAKSTISKSSFDDTKLSTAKTIISHNCLSTAQVMEICKMFSFEENKLAFAKEAYSRTTDRNNYYKVGSIFTFDSNKTELNEFISGQ